MRNFVLDASVAVKWYSKVGEDDVLKADRLLRLYEEGRCELLAPRLIAYELSNALRFNAKFELDDVRKAMREFFGLQITLVDPEEHMDAALELAFRLSLTVNDAIYAALAQVSGIPLITADYKFFDKAKDLPFVEALKDLQF
jgi:predicted nucleic acid-binding protein